MSCLRYLRLEGPLIRGKLPNSIVKLKCLETLDVKYSGIGYPLAVLESKQLRHIHFSRYNRVFSTTSFFPNNKSSLPNNLQTLMWLPDRFFQPKLLHRLTNLRKLGIVGVSDSTIKILSVSSPVPNILPNTLEILKLYFRDNTREQIKFSSYKNVVKLYLRDLGMPNNFEAFPPNLVKLTLDCLLVGSHLVAVLKKLPKLRILKMVACIYSEGKIDLSGDVNSDSFPQLEVLHIDGTKLLYPPRVYEVTCMDDVSMPKLKKVLITGSYSNVILPERFAKLRV